MALDKVRGWKERETGVDVGVRLGVGTDRRGRDRDRRGRDRDSRGRERDSRGRDRQKG